jgi:hypothetical protein
MREELLQMNTTFLTGPTDLEKDFYTDSGNHMSSAE